MDAERTNEIYGYYDHRQHALNWPGMTLEQRLRGYQQHLRQQQQQQQQQQQYQQHQYEQYQQQQQQQHYHQQQHHPQPQQQYHQQQPSQHYPMQTYSVYESQECYFYENGFVTNNHHTPNCQSTYTENGQLSSRQMNSVYNINCEQQRQHEYQHHQQHTHQQPLQQSQQQYAYNGSIMTDNYRCEYGQNYNHSYGQCQQFAQYNNTPNTIERCNYTHTTMSYVNQNIQQPQQPSQQEPSEVAVFQNQQIYNQECFYTENYECEQPTPTPPAPTQQQDLLLQQHQLRLRQQQKQKILQRIQQQQQQYYGLPQMIESMQQPQPQQQHGEAPFYDNISEANYGIQYEPPSSPITPAPPASATPPQEPPEEPKTQEAEIEIHEETEQLAQSFNIESDGIQVNNYEEIDDTYTITDLNQFGTPNKVNVTTPPTILTPQPEQVDDGKRDEKSQEEKTDTQQQQQQAAMELVMSSPMLVSLVCTDSGISNCTGDNMSTPIANVEVPLTNDTNTVKEQPEQPIENEEILPETQEKNLEDSQKDIGENSQEEEMVKMQEQTSPEVAGENEDKHETKTPKPSQQQEFVPIKLQKPLGDIKKEKAQSMGEEENPQSIKRELIVEQEKENLELEKKHEKEQEMYDMGPDLMQYFCERYEKKFDLYLSDMESEDDSIIICELCSKYSWFDFNPNSEDARIIYNPRTPHVHRTNMPRRVLLKAPSPAKLLDKPPEQLDNPKETCKEVYKNGKLKLLIL